MSLSLSFCWSCRFSSSLWSHVSMSMSMFFFNFLPMKNNWQMYSGFTFPFPSCDLQLVSPKKTQKVQDKDCAQPEVENYKFRFPKVKRWQWLAMGELSWLHNQAPCWSLSPTAPAASSTSSPVFTRSGKDLSGKPTKAKTFLGVEKVPSGPFEVFSCSIQNSDFWDIWL